jgi:hypothetical protein
MKETLLDIRAKLEERAYKNEEHVRLNLVIRILAELGWNIWDPREVNSEFVVAPNEDKTKVDLAIFLNTYTPAIFMEIKAVGQLTGKLAEIEKQLRDYNRNNTALFSIITDGQEWRFYFSQTGGEFSRKCFKVIHLHRDEEIENIEKGFKSFLSKSEILSGNARREAEGYLQLSQKQKAIEDCLPHARRLIQDPPFPSLPEVLIRLVQEKGFKISNEEAVTFIQGASEKADFKSPVPITANVPIAEPHAKIKTDGRKIINPDDPGDLRFTRVLEGRLGSVSGTAWRELLEAGIRQALRSGAQVSEFRTELTLNIVEGDKTDSGFSPVSGTNISLQGVDAAKAVRNLVAMARRYQMELYVCVRWGADSKFAGQEGVLHLMPHS